MKSFVIQKRLRLLVIALLVSLFFLDTGERLIAQKSAASVSDESTSVSPEVQQDTNLLQITPAQIDGEKKVVKLPADITDLVVAGSGRYLILHLNKVRQLAVFDVSKVKIVKYISLGPLSDISVTAGAKHLFVWVHDNKTIRRYSLTNFKRELTVSEPESPLDQGIIMGHASEGPILIGYSPQDQSVRFLNPKTLTAYELEHSTAYRVRPNVDKYCFAAADGSVFATEGGMISVVANKVIAKQKRRSGVSLPSANGSYFFENQTILDSKLNPIFQNRSEGLSIPALQSGFYITLLGTKNHLSSSAKIKGLTVHIDGEIAPLFTMRGLDDSDNRLVAYPRLPLTKQFFFVPDAKVLIQVSSPNQLIAHSLDLEKRLASSVYDYLFVDSRPSAARVGKNWRYQIQAKSKRGGVKYSIVSSPPGMTVSEKGLIQWPVAADFDQVEVKAVVKITDNSGQEIDHAVAVKIPEAAAVAARNAELERARMEAADREAALKKIVLMAPAAKATCDTSVKQLIDRIQAKSLADKKRTRPRRTWTDTDGNQFEAQLIDLFAGVAILRGSNGSVFNASTDRLIQADRNYLRQITIAAIGDRKEFEKLNQPGGPPNTSMQLLGRSLRSESLRGQPLLSWRVKLLPRIGGQRLYELFKHDEAWDSEHNKRLIPFMPDIFRSNISTKKSSSNFLAVTGKKSLLTGEKLIKSITGQPLRQKIIMIEVPDDMSVAWTKPQDWEIAEEEIPKLMTTRGDGFYACFTDNAVKKISMQNSIEDVMKAFARDGVLSSPLK